MENFKFNLQKVLDYRIDVEQKVKDEFITAQKNYFLQETLLNDLYQKRKDANNSAASLKTVNDYQSLTRYIDFIDKRILVQKDNLENAKIILHQKNKELLKSISDRKILEKLKQKALDEFSFEQSKKEQKLNDDFALFSYVRNERR
jgi:flagellar FliJ protein